MEPQEKQLTAAEYARWIKHDTGLPWLMLDMKLPWQQMLAEIEALPDEDWIRYREGSSNGKWSVCILHGLDRRPYDWAYYAKEEGWTKPEDAPNVFTEASRRCPVMMDYIVNVVGIKKQERTRIMRLDPGGVINLHHDRKHKDDPLTREIMKLTTLHFSVTNPDECDFVIPYWGKIPARNGDVFLFNNKWEHYLVNNSDKPRYHIIFNGAVWNDDFWNNEVIKGWEKFKNNYSK